MLPSIPVLRSIPAAKRFVFGAKTCRNMHIEYLLDAHSVHFGADYVRKYGLFRIGFGAFPGSKPLCLRYLQGRLLRVCALGALARAWCSSVAPGLSPRRVLGARALNPVEPPLL